MKVNTKVIYNLAMFSLLSCCEGKSIDKEIKTFSERIGIELNLLRENIKALVDTPKAPDDANTTDTNNQLETFRSDTDREGHKNDKEKSRVKGTLEMYEYLVNGLKSEKVNIRKEVEDLEFKIKELENTLGESDREIIGYIDGIKALFGDIRKRQSALEQSMKATADNLSKMISTEVNHTVSNLKRDLHNVVSSTKRDTQLIRSEHSEMEKHMNDMLSNMSARLQELEDRKDCGIWTYFQGSCYFYYHKALNWEGARKECSSLGAHLVEIDNEMEDQFITELIDKNIAESMYGTWFGASDIDNEGLWKWSASGKLLQDTYSHWTGSEPNGGRKENCLHLLRPSNKWNDINCYYKYDYICEREN